ATYPDEKNMLEAFAIFGGDFSGVNIRRKPFDMLDRFFDLCANFRVWRERRLAQPVMTDHAFLSRIGDCSALQLSHGRKRFLNLRLHFLEEIVRKIHPADVERKIEIAAVQKILLEALPER